jgi:hypothetical protein
MARTTAWLAEAGVVAGLMRPTITPPVASTLAASLTGLRSVYEIRT